MNTKIYKRIIPQFTQPLLIQVGEYIDGRFFFIQYTQPEYRDDLSAIETFEEMLERYTKVEDTGQ